MCISCPCVSEEGGRKVERGRERGGREERRKVERETEREMKQNNQLSATCKQVIFGVNCFCHVLI